LGSIENKPAPSKSNLKKQLKIQWNDEAQSAHILQLGGAGKTDSLSIRSLGIDSVVIKTLSAGLDRFILSRQSSKETGIVISWDSDCEYQNLAVLDRAHYPTELITPSTLPEQEIMFFSR